jgi:hypothetical protein
VLAPDGRDGSVDQVADLRRAFRLAGGPALELAEEGLEIFVVGHGGLAGKARDGD